MSSSSKCPWSTFPSIPAVEVELEGRSTLSETENDHWPSQPATTGQCKVKGSPECVSSKEEKMQANEGGNHASKTQIMEMRRGLL